MNSELINQVHCLDLFDLCGQIEAGSVDMILCDLPYAIGTGLKWDRLIPVDKMWVAFRRVLKPLGAIVLTGKNPFTAMLIMSNLEMFKYEWIWEKTMPTDPMNVKTRPMQIHENIIVFSSAPAANTPNQAMNYFPQDTEKVNLTVKQDLDRKASATIKSVRSWKTSYKQDTANYPKTILKFSNAHAGNSQHPTQKPIPLFEYLIRTYTQPGELVADFCVGSGTTALAARNTGRNFIVGDSHLPYVEIARQRLALPFTPPLFPETPAPLPSQVSLFGE